MNPLLWLLAAALLIFSDTALADCECGYAITSDSSENLVFTDLLESDFVHLDVTDRSQGYGRYGWAAQAFNMSMQAARGPYGEFFTLDNVVANNIADIRVFDTAGEKGGDAGVRLVVKSESVDSMLSTSEIATTDLNYFHGTFRAGIKLTGVAGTCSAFFWVRILPRWWLTCAVSCASGFLPPASHQANVSLVYSTSTIRRR